MWHRWWRHSYCPSLTWGCSRCYPSRWTRSSLSASMAPRWGCRTPPPARHGPGPQRCCLEEQEYVRDTWREEQDKYTQNEIQLTTSGFVVDAVAVENKGAVRSVDAHRHRPVLKERQLQRQRVSRCYVGVTLDLCGKLRRVNVAKAVLVKSKTGEGQKQQKASAENAKTWQKTPNGPTEKPKDNFNPFIRSHRARQQKI